MYVFTAFCWDAKKFRLGSLIEKKKTGWLGSLIETVDDRIKVSLTKTNRNLKPLNASESPAGKSGERGGWGGRGERERERERESRKFVLETDQPRTVSIGPWGPNSILS